MCVLLLLHEVVCRCLLHPVDGCVVEFNDGLTDFLPNGSVFYLIEGMQYKTTLTEFSNQPYSLDFLQKIVDYLNLPIISLKLLPTSKQKKHLADKDSPW